MPDTLPTLIEPCPDREESLVLLHYGDLGDSESRSMRLHVRDCAACAGYLKDLAAVLPLTRKAHEPEPRFWMDYNRELRNKIDAALERKTWAQKLAGFLQPRWMPAFATAAIIAVALTFTLDRALRAPADQAENPAILELMPVAENLEFFSAMDVLENLDLLESMSAQGNAA